MVTNYELKQKARTALKNNWQTALMVALIASLPSLISQVVTILTQSGVVTTLNGLLSTMQENATLKDVLTVLEQSGIAAEHYLPSALVSVVAWLISPFLTLGMLNYFFQLLRSEQEVPVSAVFSRKGCFFKGIGLNLMVDVRIILWMLPGALLGVLGLLVADTPVSWLTTVLISLMPMVMMVLGVRAALHYAMATRVMAETPGKGVNQCIRESVAIMGRRKLLLFSLEISFWLLNLGISLLESLLTGLLGNVLGATLSMALSFALNIYMQMAVSAFYLVYRADTQI